MNSNNIGVFDVEADFVRNNPDDVAQVFSMLKLVPVRVEMLFAKGVIEYTALSERFDEVPHLAIPPRYAVSVQRSETGSIDKVDVIRVK